MQGSGDTLVAGFNEVVRPFGAAISACLLTFVVLLAMTAPRAGLVAADGDAALDASIAKAPLAFEPNARRADDEIDFVDVHELRIDARHRCGLALIVVDYPEQ